jgi:hypothetical protein
VADEHDIHWADFEQAGEEEIRMRLRAHQYGEAEARLAREWLAYRASLKSSEEDEAALAEARAAKYLARSANTIALAASVSAERSAMAALNNNRIAKAALAVAIIAMIIAAIGIFTKWPAVL